MERVYNFSAGPAALPLAVLEQMQADLPNYHGQGMAIIEMSHRSKTYDKINEEAEARFKQLLGLGEGYRVLFMQGGASTQFALLPMNFLPADKVADYILTGVWSDKALEEAEKLGQTHIAASTKAGGYKRIPKQAELNLSENPAYVHYTSNNTIYGTQWHWLPDVGSRPLVCDMSSDILSRPFDATQFALIYAGAQKNLGPAGVTVVVINEDFLAGGAHNLPTMFSYNTFAKSNSLYNTPPVFAIYALNLVLQWIETEGGLTAIEQTNETKAGLIYDKIDQSGGFYVGHADEDSRSRMNITFRLPNADLDKQFAKEAEAQGMVGLAGYRSVGGIRASTYNAVTLEACQTLAHFMAEFQRTHG
jgi:phosphoserine aminotransferase